MPHEQLSPPQRNLKPLAALHRAKQMRFQPQRLFALKHGAKLRDPMLRTLPDAHRIGARTHATVGAVGFEKLRDSLLQATAGIEGPEALIDRIGRTYVRLGLENPALYRLMFGTALADAGPGDRPTVARSAGDRARAVLEEVIQRGARSGVLAVSPDSSQDQILAALSFWAALHGLTMLIIDKIPKADLSVDGMIDRLLRTLIEGLRQPRPQQQRRES
jgi:AcrR family transcriptional regulator